MNKSRALLSKDGFNSFLPTIRVQQFSDSFQGFTFLVQNKIDNEIENVFIHDKSNVLKNLTTNQSKDKTTTIVAEKDWFKKKNDTFNGSILSANIDDVENNIIKFQQLNIDLQNLRTDTITSPKLQETSTIELIKCLTGKTQGISFICKESSKKEIVTMLNRRLVLPFYIPIISLLCSFLLIQNKKRSKNFINQYSVFTLSFLVLLYAELLIRYTGISKILSLIFMITPLFLIAAIYLILMVKLSKESVSK